MFRSKFKTCEKFPFCRQKRRFPTLLRAYDRTHIAHCKSTSHLVARTKPRRRLAIVNPAKCESGAFKNNR